MCDAVTFKNALNLIDTDHYYMSGIEVFQFPGGEWHANVPAWTTDSVHVWAKLRTWDDVGKLSISETPAVLVPRKMWSSTYEGGGGCRYGRAKVESGLKARSESIPAWPQWGRGGRGE